MIILGIHDAHDAGAALMVDGQLVAAAQEERFTGLKGDYGYPCHAIGSCLRQASLDASDIDCVALATHNVNPVLTRIKRNANFGVKDWVTEQQAYWKPKLLEGRDVCYYDLFKDRPDFQYDNSYSVDGLLSGYMRPDETRRFADIRRQTIANRLGLAGDRVATITHEDCHTFYAYFAGPMRGRTLALTAEGFGDYSNATTSVFSEFGREELAHSTENHLGHIYQYITLILGMKPVQHEYKVMGLAPYADKRAVDKAFEVFRRIQKVNGLNLVYDVRPGDLYFHFRDALEGHRFDAIAGAVQRFVEECLCDWATACIRHTGLTRLIFSGGVAQNIKACKRLAEIAELEDIVICPAAGDTSLPIGACYYAMWRQLRDCGRTAESLKPLESIYVGPETTQSEIARFIQNEGVSQRFRVRPHISDDDVAARIAEGQIIGRCSGRMEFGLRALGNRSILADPRRPETVRRINAAIKYRDFWMPFTPTILAECESRYISNPKKLKCPYMTMAFDATPQARRELIAALHPADFTIRPQILTRDQNPNYYDLIRAFERLTGVGGLLNTSFNLHGEPIVLGPREALRTFDHSELDGLLLGDFLITR